MTTVEREVGISAFLAELRLLDVRVWLDGEQIRVSAPKGALTAEAREQLRLRRDEIRDALRASTFTFASPAASVVQQPDGSAFVPLSPMQERLWFFQELEPQSAAYNLSIILSLTGPLDLDLLQQCLATIVERHGVLRTTYARTASGEPRQHVHASAAVPFVVDDLTAISPDDRAREVETRWRRESELPFDLTTALPIRTRLLRLGEREHQLLVTQHHIASDGTSLVLFTRELIELYRARRTGTALSLPDLPIQYADHAVRYRKWIESPASRAVQSYWLTKLGGELPVMDLPTDHSRPAVQTYRRGALKHATLSPTTYDGLRALSRANGCTPYMALLAAFKVLLFRHSGEKDVIVGTPVVGRDTVDVSSLIGMFVNTIALRSDLSENPTFESLLGRVRQTCLEGFSNSAMPFPRLLETLRPPRDVSRSPVFQVMFNMLPGDATAVFQAGDLEIGIPSAESLASALESEARFDMTFYVREYPDGIHLGVSYNADLFSSARMDAFLEQYVRLIEGVVAAPATRIGDISLVSASAQAEAPRAKHALRRTAFTPLTSSFVESTIAQRFSEVAARRQNEPAIVTASGKWTYGELAAHATTIAHVVNAATDAGVTRVALLCDHGESMIAAMLGVLTQGSAYVPLNPGFPEQRLAALLDSAGATVLLVDPQHRALAERLAGDSRRVCLTDAPEPATRQSLPTVSGDAVAYILYTSGSSGEPKGISQTQRNVLHYARGYVNALEITPEDRLTLVPSYTFDASVVDIYSGLLAGAALFPAQLLIDGLDGIANVIREQRITIFHCTPTLYRAISAHLPSASDVRCVVLGGEQVHPHDFDQFQSQFDQQAVFVNLYGASEASIASMALLEANADRSRAVEIGDPIEETEVLLVDTDGNPTPVTGEVAIRSRFLALGYWNAPELTRRAFLPIEGESERRLYRTGDLGRRRPDGTIEYLGRKDNQIKIRGVRIEPGEIEAALLRHPHVAEGVVVADRSREGRPVLLGFVVAAAGAALDAADVKTHIAQSLPEYMVPATIVVLEALPLTRTGKVDRRALPTADALGVADRPTAVQPRDAIEQMLADIWSDVLELPHIGVRDNFFSLGGSSLNATQVVARAHALGWTGLDLRTLFASPTIEELASTLRTGDNSVSTHGPKLTRRSIDGDSPLSYSQQRMWFLHEIMPGATAYNICAGLQLTGRLDRDALHASIGHIAMRHDSLRSTFHVRDGEPRQRVVGSTEVRFLEHDVTDLPAAERVQAAERIAVEYGMRPFDLEQGPLWWMLVIRVAEDRHILVLGIHHIIGDVWSLGVIGRELTHFYNARVRGEHPSLAEAEIQYGDYSFWQLDSLTGERLAREIGYWRSRLAGLTTLALPTDRPRPALQTANGNRAHFSLPSDLVRSLRLLSVREGVTPFMVLFTAFNVALRRWTGQEDIVVGVPIANRTHVGLESLIGTFVNTLVHRNDVSGNPSFREAVKRVRGVALDAFSHQDLPFERLVREVTHDRDPSRSPLFQVMFNVANAPIAQRTMDGLTQEPFMLARRAAQFDLTVTISVGDTSVGEVSYNTDLFDASTIDRFLATYLTVLEAAVREPDRTIDQLPVMPAADRDTLIQSQGDASPLPTESVVALARAQAARTPDAIAIEADKSSLTFAELDARANQLARHLRSKGVSDGSLVGVCLQRSPDVVVALLAVLKAGAAYVPVDPEYPSHRVRYMLEDSGAVAVIAQKATLGRIPETNAVVVAVDRDAAAIAAEASAPLDSVPSVDALAYVLYTSGSTGNPKGVEIPHGALSNFLMSMAKTPGLSSTDTLLAVTTISFDIAGLEVYLPLVTGATIVLASREVASDAKRLRDLLVRRKPTVMQATPATWRGLIDAGWAIGDTPGLKILCGGEALPRELASELLPRAGEVWNMYGPTETTIWSTVERVTDEPGPISIGRPIANTRVYVLDAAGELLPVGVPGELFIGGAGVARGYHGRPDLTEARFVRDPFAADGSRMYRTGDRARVRPDGSLEHLGRLDNQVKLRGYRIELGEVESALAQLPAVAQSVVDVRQDRLVAYVVFAGSEQLTASEVRAHLRETLPDYMVPSLIVPLDRFPLTPNGKVDRRALPDPLRTTARTAATHVAPTTPTETVIANVWKELLGVERVSVDDNFFELGGHSLLSVRAVHEIQQRTGWRPDPRLLFFETLGKIASTRPAA